jgi:DNA-nicking Smr family endonuclease
MQRKNRRPAAAPISAEDAALFREAIGAVARVQSDRAEVRPTPPAPDAAHTRADERAAFAEIMRKPLAELALDLAEPLSYVREGGDKRLLRQLGRGHFSIRAELDLHRLTSVQAQAAIADFLDEQRRGGRLCVRIIHGKGLNSKNAEPVLKGVTDRALRQRGDVLAFRSARAADGGTGAVIVLLRK